DLFRSIRGTMVSDRARQFGFWAMKRRQICWAHLCRKFVGFAEQPGEVGKIGGHLLCWAQLLIHYWHNVRDGTMSRRKFQRVVVRLSAHFEAWLEAGVRLQVRGFSG